MHVQMRTQNGRLNKAKVGALVFWAFGVLDMAGCSIAAAIFALREAAVRPCWMLGPLVFNPISVPLAFAGGVVLWMVGRFSAKPGSQALQSKAEKLARPRTANSEHREERSR